MTRGNRVILQCLKIEETRCIMYIAPVNIIMKNKIQVSVCAYNNYFSLRISPSPQFQWCPRQKHTLVGHHRWQIKI